MDLAGNLFLPEVPWSMMWQVQSVMAVRYPGRKISSKNDKTGGLKCDKPLYNVSSWLNMNSSFMSLFDIAKSAVIGDANNSGETKFFFLFEGLLQTLGSDKNKSIL